MTGQSAKQLEEAALRYLERFATSTTHLRRVLLRRVRRIAMREDLPPEITDASLHIDAIIEKFIRLGLLNDQNYAETKAGSLHRRGASARKIAASLAAKGIGPSLIKTALDTDESERGPSSRPGGDLAAAAALARRRRFGPYRQAENRDATRQKDLATLARAGFSRQIAEQILNCRDSTALAALLQELADGTD